MVPTGIEKQLNEEALCMTKRIYVANGNNSSVSGTFQERDTYQYRSIDIEKLEAPKVHSRW